MLSNRILKKLYIPCAVCVDKLGYEEDAPKFASERGLKRHLLNEHGVTVNKKPRFEL